MKVLIGFLRNAEGATAVEYGLLAAVLGGVVIAAFGALSGDLQTIFTTISNSISKP